MRYISTRGEAPVLSFSDVLLTGLAEDGGLYLPQTWPSLSPEEWHALRGLPYPELAARILSLFTGDDIDEATLRQLCAKAYAGFDHPAVVPVVQLENGLFVQELFHGPTLAFKDMAMQILGHLFEHVLSERDSHVTIVGATSGDTGSAAIEACRGRKRLSVIILHPKGRTSEVQRRQMTTVHEANVTNLAVEGTFDDCQDLVKACFADLTFRKDMHLSAVNSINWARIAAQIPYYVYAALNFGAPGQDVSFAVPTGNFGNILAAWAARKMGLPVSRLCVGSNRNDILTRFLNKNDMTMKDVVPSLSPSMDIQVSSNFERLLFELLDRDAAACARIMTSFRSSGHMDVPEQTWEKARTLFSGLALDDAQTEAEIRHLHQNSHYMADPHSAIGIAAGRKFRDKNSPMIAVATAHPAKFPDAMVAATGIHPALPEHLADLFSRKEYYETIPATADAVKNAVRTAVANTH
ncbi:threonine synthase [Acetobacter thailandicus]|uniref:Threonine synthase n=1 Tax=Acetobacter thailandicus TaxID=1502842 RepID=A0ABT3QAV8_9PROT|nr:threonine synthase [Acetobacter thailandicus]MCX2562423.1 threonine synthase [Acetobacter thailandicus]NHN94490.1 threonine synthase [Acetobacter thailandicus]